MWYIYLGAVLAIVVIATLMQWQGQPQEEPINVWRPLPELPHGTGYQLAGLEILRQQGSEYAEQDQIYVIWEAVGRAHDLTTHECYMLLEQWRRR